MEKEKYKIVIESKGPYETKKEFNFEAEMNTREYTALINLVLDFVEGKPKSSLEEHL